MTDETPDTTSPVYRLHESVLAVAEAIGGMQYAVRHATDALRRLGALPEVVRQAAEAEAATEELRDLVARAEFDDRRKNRLTKPTNGG